MSQFDTSTIDKEWVDQYIKLILDNWDIFSQHQYDIGHTPHFKHKIESTTEEPVYVKQFKIAIGDEATLDEMSTHLTAARILIEQPSENNPRYLWWPKEVVPILENKDSSRISGLQR